MKKLGIADSPVRHRLVVGFHHVRQKPAGVFRPNLSLDFKKTSWRDRGMEARACRGKALILRGPELQPVFSTGGRPGVRSPGPGPPFEPGGGYGGLELPRGGQQANFSPVSGSAGFAKWDSVQREVIRRQARW